METCKIDIHRRKEYRQCQKTKIQTLNDLCVKCYLRSEVKEQIDYLIDKYSSMKLCSTKNQLEEYLKGRISKNQERIRFMNQLHFEAEEYQKQDKDEIMQAIDTHNRIRFEAIEVIKYCNIERQLLVNENKKGSSLQKTCTF